MGMGMGGQISRRCLLLEEGDDPRSVHSSPFAAALSELGPSARIDMKG
jgi:hypothetical protein